MFKSGSVLSSSVVQPAYIQLSYFCLLCVAPWRLNQETFQLKLQTFPFKKHFKHQICMGFLQFESSTAHALFHSLEIYKETSPVWNGASVIPYKYLP